jgi:predicted HTH domain antitoxin
MVTIPVAIPLLGSVSADEARLFLALKLFEIGRLSCGQAADLVGYSKRTFMELLGKHSVAVFDYAAAELDELTNA